MRFMELVHAEDERIPADTLDFGTIAIGRLLRRIPGGRVQGRGSP
jgi:hypothetical protein